MLRWLSRFGTAARVQRQLVDAGEIINHVMHVLVRETDLHLYQYGQAIQKIVDERAAARKAEVAQVIYGSDLTWRDVSRIEDSVKNIHLMLLTRIGKHDPSEAVDAKIDETCQMILAQHFKLAIMRGEIPDVLKEAYEKQKKLYLGLVTELYLVGTEESTAEDFRTQIRSCL